MNKLSIVIFALLALAVAACATGTTPNMGHQCVPEPITMLALIPGIGMLIRRRANKA